ncbi:hypothetical protein FIBSPDRAFT_967925 [Athelia psychrophila]|uniref:Uncharacterized protein n=1 Tax=Athelia psychrophila TaxID=1759441 RepID=A0A167V682_9AGAM|nr:hypothetical protein FIBSPDRAFT_967925 [Fibularhizoctonia sp. CBS 109695]
MYSRSRHASGQRICPRTHQAHADAPAPSPVTQRAHASLHLPHARAFQHARISARQAPGAQYTHLPPRACPPGPTCTLTDPTRTSTNPHVASFRARRFALPLRAPPMFSSRPASPQPITWRPLLSNPENAGRLLRSTNAVDASIRPTPVSSTLEQDAVHICRCFTAIANDPPPRKPKNAAAPDCPPRANHTHHNRPRANRPLPSFPLPSHMHPLPRPIGGAMVQYILYNICVH